MSPNSAFSLHLQPLCGMQPILSQADNCSCCGAEEEIFKMVLKADLDFKTAPWPSVSAEAKDCVRQLLNRNAPARATAESVLRHPWLTQQGLASDKPLDNVVIQRMRQVRLHCTSGVCKPVNYQRLYRAWLRGHYQHLSGE